MKTPRITIGIWLGLLAGALTTLPSLRAAEPKVDPDADRVLRAAC